MIDASAMFKLVQVGKGLKYVLDSGTNSSSGKCAHKTLFSSIKQFKKYICCILVCVFLLRWQDGKHFSQLCCYKCAL